MKTEWKRQETLTSNIPLASTPALLLRKAIKASVGSSAVSSITALKISLILHQNFWLMDCYTTKIVEIN